VDSLTLVLLSYQRPQNIITILTSIAGQTVKPDVFLWNNSGHPVHRPEIDWCVDSSANLFCWPRWQMAANANTEYVAVMDDDLCFRSPTFIERLIAYMTKLQSEIGIVGLEGVLLGEPRDYYPTYGGRMARKEIPQEYAGTVHIASPTRDVKVHIVKGRFMVCRTEFLQELLFNPPFKDVCDDIVISSLLRKGDSQSHLIPSWLSTEFDDLPEKNGSMALSAQPDFKDIRRAAADLYFSD
jgi:hypothetical protein